MEGSGNGDEKADSVQGAAASGGDSGRVSPRRNHSMSPLRSALPIRSALSPVRTRSTSPRRSLTGLSNLPMSPGLIAAKAALQRATGRSGAGDYSHIVTDDIRKIREMRAALRSATSKAPVETTATPPVETYDDVTDLIASSQQLREERAPFLYRSRYNLAPPRTTSPLSSSLERSVSVENALLRESLEQELLVDRSLHLENQVLRESLDKEREVDRTLSLENQVLRESLDKERRIDQGLIHENTILKDTVGDEKYKRQQTESECLHLQGKLAEAESALTAERLVLSQKGAMIEELDDTLAKVVLGWQRKEGERLEAVEMLERERREAMAEVTDYKKKVMELEDEVQRGNEGIELEQRRYNRMELEKNTFITELQDRLEQAEGERGRLAESLATERGLAQQLHKEKGLAVSGRDHMVRELADVQAALEGEKQAAEAREQDMLDKIDEITTVQIKVLEEERRKMEVQQGRQRGLEGQLVEEKRAHQQTKHDLDAAQQACERLKETMHLESVRHENSTRQLKDDYASELDTKIADITSKSLQNLADREVELCQAHRRQISELNDQHARQLADITERYGMDIAKMRDRYEEQLNRLDDLNKELGYELTEVKEQKLRVEVQRNQTNARLQHMMQAHANEALRVITNGTTYLSPVHVSPNSSPKKVEYEALTHAGEEVGSDVVRAAAHNCDSADDGDAEGHNGTVATVGYMRYDSSSQPGLPPPPSLFSDAKGGAAYMGETIAAARTANGSRWGEKVTTTTKEQRVFATSYETVHTTTSSAGSPDMYPYSHRLSHESSTTSADLPGFPRDLSGVSGAGTEGGEWPSLGDSDKPFGRSREGDSAEVSIASIVKTQGLSREQQLHLYVKKLLGDAPPASLNLKTDPARAPSPTKQPTSSSLKTSAAPSAFTKEAADKSVAAKPTSSGRASPVKRGRKHHRSSAGAKGRLSPRRRTPSASSAQAKYQVMTPEKVNEIAQLISRYGKEDSAIGADEFLDSLREIKQARSPSKTDSRSSAQRALAAAFAPTTKKSSEQRQKGQLRTTSPTASKSPVSARKTKVGQKAKRIAQPSRERKRSAPTTAWR